LHRVWSQTSLSLHVTIFEHIVVNVVVIVVVFISSVVFEATHLHSFGSQANPLKHNEFSTQGVVVDKATHLHRIWSQTKPCLQKPLSTHTAGVLLVSVFINKKILNKFNKQANFLDFNIYSLLLS
jgi:hypothetical protein